MGKIKEDIEILKMLCDLSPDEVYYKVAEKALSCGYKAEQIHLNENGMYMYIEGDLTYPALVAHVDTVNDYSSNGKEQKLCTPPKEFFYDNQKRVLWSPDLAGFDDRAGILGIFNLLDTGYKFPIILLNYEEIGGKGAIEFCNDYIGKVKFKFFVELDRQGRGESVFYDCNNSFFEFYVNSFGFKTAKGIFSDIYFLAQYFDAAAVNLSIGYVDEHFYTERIFFDDFYFTISKVKHMLKTAEKAPYFIYF